MLGLFFSFVNGTFCIIERSDYMNIDISKLCHELEGEYPDGGYVSRATIFNRALSEGKITEEVRDRAREYYGRLWNYVGD